MGPDQIHNILDYVIQQGGDFLLNFTPLGWLAFLQAYMAEAPPLIRHPAVHLWAVAVRTGTTRQVLCSNRSKASLQQKLDSGRKQYKVGSYEFRERQAEAEEKIKKRVGLMMRPSTGANSGFVTARRIKLALHRQKLWSGLWPIC